MPSYRFSRGDDEQDVVCSIDEYDDLKESMEKEGWRRVFTPTPSVGMVGSVLSRTDEGFRDVLKNIKKGSGKKNTINV